MGGGSHEKKEIDGELLRYESYYVFDHHTPDEWGMVEI